MDSLRSVVVVDVSCFLYVTMSVLILGIQAVPTQQQASSMAAASMLSAAGAYPATHPLGGGGGIALQPTPAQHVASAQQAQQAQPQQIQAVSAPGQHSSNPAIDAALSQAYSGIAQYTGTTAY